MSAEAKTKLINRKHVKAFALAAAAKRAHKFTRVGGEFFIRCEANLKGFIRNSSAVCRAKEKRSSNPQHQPDSANSPHALVVCGLSSFQTERRSP